MQKFSKHILQITPQFAPGQCGVSDYVQRWQEQMAAGTECYFLALNDRYDRGMQEMANGIKIGADVPVNQKLKIAAEVLQQPFDGVVLHYVPLGYHPKGLPYWLNQLAELLASLSCPVTIVLHEIWAGGPGKSLSTRIKGKLQKRLLLNLLRKLPGARIVTTSALTAHMIRQEGFVAAHAPVFNNLGEAENGELLDADILEQCQSAGWYRVLLFGSLPPEGGPEKVAGFLAGLWQSDNPQVMVWHAGQGYRPGWWQLVEKELDREKARLNLGGDYSCSFRALGPLPSAAINYLMRHCDAGLSTYPFELWSKSGSIAAMRANGLPVVVLGKLPPQKGMFKPELPPGVVYQEISPSGEPSALPPAIHKNPDLLYNQKVAGTLYELTGIGHSSSACEPFSVVITVYKSWEQALHCLKMLTLHAAADPIREILVIQDEPGAVVPPALKDYPLVKLVENEQNLGYVVAVNKGIGLAACNRVLLLDSDAYVQTPVSPAMQLLGGENGYALCMPACFHADGTKTRLFYPAPGWFSLIVGQLGENLADRFLKSPQVVVHSYAWAIYKPTWQALGGLDENFRFIESDIDFCMRLERQFPGRLVFCPAVSIQHDGGSSSFNRNKRVLEWYRCRFHIFRKQYGPVGLPFLKLLVKTRLTLEKWVAGGLARVQPANAEKWLQKKQGRAGLLGELKNW